MDFFKNNPAALMDAIPTPPGSDNGEQPQANPYNTGFDTSINNKSKHKKVDDNFETTSIRSG